MKKMPPLPGFPPTKYFSPFVPAARPGLFGSSRRVQEGVVIPHITATNPPPYPFALPPSALGPDAVAALAARPAAQPPLPLQTWAGAAGTGVDRNMLLAGAKVPFGPAEQATARPDRTLPPEVIAAAQASQRNTGVPASVSIAQWIWESGWGQHIPKDSNKYFGVKEPNPAKPRVEQKTVEFDKAGRRMEERHFFRRYQSPEESWDAHARLFSREGRYAKAMSLVRDPDLFVDAMANVYAPNNKAYAPNINRTMRARNLYQYNVLPGTK